MGLFDRLFRRRRNQDSGISPDPALNTFTTGYPHTSGHPAPGDDDRGGSRDDPRGEDARDSGPVDPSVQQIEVGESNPTQDIDVGGGDSGGGGGDGGGGGGGE